jgi:hypothetical protein
MRDYWWGVKFFAVIGVAVVAGVWLYWTVEYPTRMDRWARLIPVAIVLDILFTIPLRDWRAGIRRWPFRATPVGNSLLVLDALLLVAGVLYFAPVVLCCFFAVGPVMRGG